MSRLTQSPIQSPSFRAERLYRTSTIIPKSPLEGSSTSATTTSNRKNVLLSENQLNKISKNLANVRHVSISEPGLYEPEPAPIQSSPTMIQQDKRQQGHSINEFTVQIQEYAIIEDLLYILIGIDGTFIHCIYPNNSRDDDDLMEDDSSKIPEADNLDAIDYYIDPTLDPSLKHLVKKILPLSTYYISIHRFVEQYSRFEYGTINHALCAGIRVFLKEYLTFIAQLEHEFQTALNFTLQRLWFYAQDLLQSMKIIHQLVQTIRSIATKKETQDSDEENNINAVIEDLQQEEQNEAQIPENQKGGAILNILAEGLIGLSGDPKCKKIYSFLLSKASVPYFEILNSWIYHGEIKDSYQEFMILEKKNVKKENIKEDYNDTYWETRYTIREGLVPVFLEPMKNQILLAGKFLNVVRECGVSIANPEEMNEILGQVAPDQHYMPTRNDVWAAVDGSRFAKNLDVAYKYANQTLLNLLMKDLQLLGRLRSLKHYFFLDQADFLTSFLDLAKEELKQPASKIAQTRLQSLMDLVLRNPSSVAAYDPFKEDVKVSMSHLRLIDQLLRIINVSGMDAGTTRGLLDGLERNPILWNTSAPNQTPLTGYDALTLDYTVTFPLSLIISRKALTKYQLLFRHILYMKHAEDSLCQTWINQKNSLWKTRSAHPEIQHWKFRIVTLRNRMLTFVQQFTYYITNEVLEPNWARLELNVSRASTVDEVLQYHSDFLDTCLKECMLTNSKLLRIFSKVMAACVAFLGQAEKYNVLLATLEEEQKKDRYGIPGLKESTIASFDASSRTLSKIEEAFAYHIGLLIDGLNFFSAQETVQFLCLVVRLDYNQVYKTKDKK